MAKATKRSTSARKAGGGTQKNQETKRSTSTEKAAGGIQKDQEYVLRMAKEHNVKFVRFWFTDMLGHLKNFLITHDELEATMYDGQGFDGSSIEGFARIDESDMVAMPDPSSFEILPWMNDAGNNVARMFCDIVNPDRSPFEGDPRYVLKRNLAEAAELGYAFYVGPELEFFLFKGSTGRRSSITAAISICRSWTWLRISGAKSSKRSSRLGSSSSTLIMRSPPANTRLTCATRRPSPWRTTA